MSTITVNFCVKEPKDYINYKLETFTINTENFPIKIWKKEVKNLSFKQKKKLFKVMKAFILTTTTFLTLSSKSMANTLNHTQSIPSININTPLDIIDPLIQLLLIAFVIITILAMAFLMSAGFLRMVKKKKEAVEWTEDIIMGLIQVLISIPLVFLIYLLVTSLFGDFKIFLDVFKNY